MRGGAAELQRGLRRDRLDVRHAADAVRSENFLILRHVGYSKAARAIRKRVINC